MEVVLDRRAEIALRSLSDADRVKVEGVFSNLSTANPATWHQSVQAHRMHLFRGEMLYSIQAGDQIRLLSKVLSDVLIIQDIFPRERLEHISGINL